MNTALNQELATPSTVKEHGPQDTKRTGEYLRAIVDITPSPIYLKDSNYRYLLVNKRYEQLAHISEQEIIGKTDFEIFPEPVALLFRSQDEQVVKRKAVLEFEETIELPDGECSFITSKFPLTDEEGNIYAIGGFCTEITQRKKTEKELKETQQKLIHADKMIALGQLMAGISHEVGNSVNFITAALPSLKKQHNDIKKNYVPKTTQEKRPDAGISKKLWDNIELLMDNISEGARRIHETIGNLRLFSLYDRDEEPRLVDVHETLASTLSLLSQELKRKNIHVIRKFGAGQNVISCFPDRLSQAFVNIILNAIQAIEKNGNIYVSTSDMPGNILVNFEDDGCGMSPDLAKRVFEPFFTTKDVGEGTGLGLSITHELIKEIKGEIKLSSTEGKGSSFLLVLPVGHHSHQ